MLMTQVKTNQPGWRTEPSESAVVLELTMGTFRGRRSLSLPVWWGRMTLVMVLNVTRTHKLIMPHHISLSHADEGV